MTLDLKERTKEEIKERVLKNLISLKEENKLEIVLPGYSNIVLLQESNKSVKEDKVYSYLKRRDAEESDKFRNGKTFDKKIFYDFFKIQFRVMGEEEYMAYCNMLINDNL